MHTCVTICPQVFLSSLCLKIKDHQLLLWQSSVTPSPEGGRVSPPHHPKLSLASLRVGRGRRRRDKHCQPIYKTILSSTLCHTTWSAMSLLTRKGRWRVMASSKLTACSRRRKGRSRATRAFPFPTDSACRKPSSAALQGHRWTSQGSARAEGCCQKGWAEAKPLSLPGMGCDRPTLTPDYSAPGPLRPGRASQPGSSAAQSHGAGQARPAGHPRSPVTEGTSGSVRVGREEEGVHVSVSCSQGRQGTHC